MKDRDERSPCPSARHSPASRAGTLTLSGCEKGHVFFFPHASCPTCGASLAPTESPPDAVLVSRTTVRVGPAGVPFALGLVRVACGAQTLCIVDDELVDDTMTDVVIEKRDGLYRAKPKTTR